MNNINLTSLINLYGGNDDPNKYTSSLLNKYTGLKEKTIIKIDNLETLLVDDSESDSENNIFETRGGNNKIIKIDNLDNFTIEEESETFSSLVSRIFKH